MSFGLSPIIKCAFVYASLLIGCDSQSQGPCGCPPIVDDNKEPVEAEAEEAICSEIEKVEQDYPPLSCNIRRITILPNEVYNNKYNEEDFDENACDDDTCAELAETSGAKYSFVTNTLYLRKSLFELEPASPFLQKKTISQTAKQALLHETVHSRQDVAEKHNDFGWDIFRTTIGAATEYIGKAWTSLDSSDASHLVSRYSAKTKKEDHAETLSILYCDPFLGITSSSPDFEKRISFAEEQWNQSFPPTTPDQVNISYATTNFEIDDSDGGFFVYDDTFAYVDSAGYCRRESRDEEFICPLDIYPYDQNFEEFSATPEYFGIEYPNSGNGVGSYNSEISQETISFANGYMASIWLESSPPVLVISDLESGTSIENELDLPDCYSEIWLETTIYDGQVFVMPYELYPDTCDPTVDFIFPRYNLYTGEELEPLELLDLTPLTNNGYTDSLDLHYVKKGPNNPYLGARVTVHSPESGHVNQVLIISLEQNSDEKDPVTIQTDAGLSFVDTAGTSIYLSGEQDDYLNEWIYPIATKTTLGTDIPLLATNVNMEESPDISSLYQWDVLSISDTAYIIYADSIYGGDGYTDKVVIRKVE